MYADDTQLYFNTNTKNMKNTISDANAVLQNVHKYCINNVLKLNEKKCFFMLIGSKPAMKKIEDININPIIINNTIVE